MGTRQGNVMDLGIAGRFGDPADMGNLVAFLVSPLAAYINGAHIPVDGGAVRLAT